jgi:hypothetical protein
MRRFRAPLILIAALAVAAFAAGTAVAKTTAFTATFKGTVTEKVDGQMVTASTKGSGKATLLGKSTIAGLVTANTSTATDSGCAPFNGPGTITGTGGKLKVTVLPASRGCAASQEQQNDITVSGTVKVGGGTGKYKKAKATLHFSGHYDRSSGAFTVKLTGKLSY